MQAEPDNVACVASPDPDAYVADVVHVEGSRRGASEGQGPGAQQSVRQGAPWSERGALDRSSRLTKDTCSTAIPDARIAAKTATVLGSSINSSSSCSSSLAQGDRQPPVIPNADKARQPSPSLVVTNDDAILVQQTVPVPVPEPPSVSAASASVVALAPACRALQGADNRSSVPALASGSVDDDQAHASHGLHASEPGAGDAAAPPPAEAGEPEEEYGSVPAELLNKAPAELNEQHAEELLAAVNAIRRSTRNVEEKLHGWTLIYNLRTERSLIRNGTNIRGDMTAIDPQDGQKFFSVVGLKRRLGLCSVSDGLFTAAPSGGEKLEGPEEAGGAAVYGAEVVGRRLTVYWEDDRRWCLTRCPTGRLHWQGPANPCPHVGKCRPASWQV